VETTIAQQRTQLLHEVARKRHLGLEALTRSHFTALRRPIEFTYHGLHRSSKDERTVITACLKSAKHNGRHDRSAYKNGHARNSSWPGELISNQRPDTLTQTASPRPQLFPCSRAADHTLCLLTPSAISLGW
jgi:hypothetical protein